MEVGRVGMNLGQEVGVAKNRSGNQPQGFGKVLLDALTEVNNLQIEADDAIQSVALGQEEDLHRAIIAMEKANLALGLTVQVRNKVIEAYQEIMRMQL
ncbi:MAG: flagellar hook-basal body complex protein FliE [Candidatus Atribacteria bacterium]|nr:flagellar hook-basal body complex protein FliE [Candidatus Atribacteria bacterium]